METTTDRVVFTTRSLRRAARVFVRKSIPFSTRRLWAAGSLFYGVALFTYSLFRATRCFRYHRIGFLLWEPFCLFEVFYFFLFTLIAFTSTRADSQETLPAHIGEKTAAKRSILRRRFQNSGRDAAIGAAFACFRPSLVYSRPTSPISGVEPL